MSTIYKGEDMLMPDELEWFLQTAEPDEKEDILKWLQATEPIEVCNQISLAVKGSLQK